MTTDIEIARLAKPKKISEVAKKLGIPEDKLFNYGNHKAKISIDYLDSLNS